MSKANEKQIGGTHYQSSYQHWDFADALGLPYMVGRATAYIARWRKKGGIKDLQKGLHFIEKELENEEVLFNQVTEIVQDFINSNSINEEEFAIIKDLVNYQFPSREELVRAKTRLSDYIARVQKEGQDWVDETMSTKEDLLGKVEK